MRMFAFRQYDPNPEKDKSTGTAQVTAERRRQQLRKAQRSHRERKNHYVKSLESQVLQYRVNEAQMLREVKALHNEISRLNKILEEHGVHASSLPSSPPTDISSPLGSSIDNHSDSYFNTIVSFQDKGGFGGGPQLHIRHIGTSGAEIPGFDIFLNRSSVIATSMPLQKRSFFRRQNGRKHDALENNGAHSGPAPMELQSATLASGEAPPLGIQTKVCAMDLTTVGTEFVLALESPCLPHIHGNPKDPSASTGHAFTASAELLLRAPAPVPQLHHCAQWEAPHLSLERLLEISSNLGLEEGQMTPVQAWAYIRQHQGFGGMDADTFRKLTENLLETVRCYGFGAVVNQAVLENCVLEALVAGTACPK